MSMSFLVRLLVVNRQPTDSQQTANIAANITANITANMTRGDITGTDPGLISGLPNPTTPEITMAGDTRALTVSEALRHACKFFKKGNLFIL
jgi:hypothetical protein